MTDFDYADPSSWEDWQQEYRYGAFYIFPPDGTIEAIDALRRTCDPRSAAYCQAHLSLSEPLTKPLTAAQVQELRHRLALMEPFEIRYGPLRSFPPYPGVTYAIYPEDRFMKLRALVHSTSPFHGATLTRAERLPHMTIAEFITVERTDALLQSLAGHVPEGTFQCSAIEYAVPDDVFYFERVLTIPLGTASG